MAIRPFPIGFCPPEIVQVLAYGLRAVHWIDLSESIAALPICGLSPSKSINCAGKTTSHFKVMGARPGSEVAEISSVTSSPAALVTVDTGDVWPRAGKQHRTM